MLGKFSTPKLVRMIGRNDFLRLRCGREWESLPDISGWEVPHPQEPAAHSRAWMKFSSAHYGVVVFIPSLSLRICLPLIRRRVQAAGTLSRAPFFRGLSRWGAGGLCLFYGKSARGRRHSDRARTANSSLSPEPPRRFRLP